MAGKARMAGKRTESLVVRLTPEEVKMVRGLAGRHGKTVSEWIRERIYHPPAEEAAELWRVAQAIAAMERPAQESTTRRKPAGPTSARERNRKDPRRSHSKKDSGSLPGGEGTEGESA